jgi:hypothetical protein
MNTQPSPLLLPCLLWEPSLDAIVLATEMGTGTVLKVGQSKFLKVGMVIPWAANRWVAEEWDFILPPPELNITLRNIKTPGREMYRLGIDLTLRSDEAGTNRLD